MGKYFGKIVRNVFLGHSHHSKTLYAGGVDNVAAKIEVKHLGKCGGVFALKAVHRNIARAQSQTRVYAVYQCAFACAAVARNQCGFVFEHSAQCVNVFACLCRHRYAIVAYFCVNIHRIF